MPGARADDRSHRPRRAGRHRGPGIRALLGRVRSRREPFVVPARALGDAPEPLREPFERGRRGGQEQGRGGRGETRRRRLEPPEGVGQERPLRAGDLPSELRGRLEDVWGLREHFGEEVAARGCVAGVEAHERRDRSQQATHVAVWRGAIDREPTGERREGLAMVLPQQVTDPVRGCEPRTGALLAKGRDLVGEGAQGIGRRHERSIFKLRLCVVAAHDVDDPPLERPRVHGTSCRCLGRGASPYGSHARDADAEASV